MLELDRRFTEYVYKTHAFGAGVDEVFQCLVTERAKKKKNTHRTNE